MTCLNTRLLHDDDDDGRVNFVRAFFSPRRIVRVLRVYISYINTCERRAPSYTRVQRLCHNDTGDRACSLVGLVGHSSFVPAR